RCANPLLLPGVEPVEQFVVDEIVVVGVLLDEALDERADRHDPQIAPARVVEGAADQLRREAASGELVADLRVDADQPAAAHVVLHESGEGTVVDDLEAGPVLVVAYFDHDADCSRSERANSPMPRRYWSHDCVLPTAIAFASMPPGKTGGT